MSPGDREVARCFYFSSNFRGFVYGFHFVSDTRQKAKPLALLFVNKQQKSGDFV